MRPEGAGGHSHALTWLPTTTEADSVRCPDGALADPLYRLAWLGRGLAKEDTMMGWGAGGWIFMGIGMVLFWALVIFGILWVVRALSDRDRGPSSGRPRARRRHSRRSIEALPRAGWTSTTTRSGVAR
jgi:hypothetical protein